MKLVSGWPRFAQRCAVLIILTLAGCGGGDGSSNSTGTGTGGETSTAFSMTASPNPLNVTAAINDVQPVVTVTLNIANAPADDTYIGGSFTQNGIVAVELISATKTNAILHVTFKPPTDQPPGTNLSDTLQLALCRDTNCNDIVTDSLITIPITYAVKSPDAGSLPTIASSTSQISVHALITGQSISWSPDTNSSPNAFSIPLTIQHAAYTPTYTVETSWNSVQSAQMIDPINPTLYVTLNRPQAAGSYHDTITVHACLDAGCVNPVASVVTITVDYLVTDSMTVSGTSGYTLRFINVTNINSLAWDSTHGLLYATNLASIFNLEPAAGMIDSQYLAYGLSGLLRLTSDNSVAFGASSNYGALSQYTLPNWISAGGISYEHNSYTPSYDTADIAIQPGSTGTIAVARTYGGMFGIPADIGIYDNGTRRTNSVVTAYGASGVDVGFLQWGGTAQTLFGSTPPSYMPATTWRLSVDANGVTQAATYAGTGGPFQYAYGKLYYISGGLTVLNATTGALVSSGTISGATLSALTVDTSLGTLYALGTDSLGVTTIWVLDAQTLAIRRSASLGAFHPAGLLTRWGTNGLATSDGTAVYLFSGALVAP